MKEVILNLLQEEKYKNGISSTDIANLLDSSSSTISKYLQELISENLIVKYQIENVRLYKLSYNNTDYSNHSGKEKTVIIESASLLENISESEMNDFLEYMQTTPFLALENDIGKKIYSGLEKEVSNHICVMEKGTKIYHSRKREENQTISYTTNEMWNAPFNSTSLGRFNFCGVPFFYTAESETLAIKELKLKEKENGDVMELQSKRKFNFFDMSYSNCHLFVYCKQTKNKNNSSREYLIPNYIAQTIIDLRKKGKIQIDGIKYPSTRTKSGEMCYVFFNIDQNDFDSEMVLK